MGGEFITSTQIITVSSSLLCRSLSLKTSISLDVDEAAVVEVVVDAGTLFCIVMSDSLVGLSDFSLFCSEVGVSGFSI